MKRYVCQIFVELGIYGNVCELVHIAVTVGGMNIPQYSGAKFDIEKFIGRFVKRNAPGVERPLRPPRLKPFQPFTTGSKFFSFHIAFTFPDMKSQAAKLEYRKGNLENR